MGSYSVFHISPLVTRVSERHVNRNGVPNAFCLSLGTSTGGADGPPMELIKTNIGNYLYREYIFR